MLCSPDSWTKGMFDNVILCALFIYCVPFDSFISEREESAEKTPFEWHLIQSEDIVQVISGGSKPFFVFTKMENYYLSEIQNETVYESSTRALHMPIKYFERFLVFVNRTRHDMKQCQCLKNRLRWMVLCYFIRYRCWCSCAVVFCSRFW